MNVKHREMIVVKNKRELKELINQRIEERGPNCDLNDIDVSNVIDMSFLFYNTDFNGDISQWDVSNVVDMSGMFAWSKFNGDISNWNVSKAFYMNKTFYMSPLSDNKPSWYRGI